MARARRRSAVKRVRGVENSKYLILARMVRNGETTWEELEAKGIVQPPKRESAYRREVKAKLAQ